MNIVSGVFSTTGHVDLVDRTQAACQARLLLHEVANIDLSCNHGDVVTESHPSGFTEVASDIIYGKLTNDGFKLPKLIRHL